MNLNRKITIYTNTPIADGAGGTKFNWDAGQQKFANIEVTNDGKLFIQGQEYNGTYYTLIMRSQSFTYTPPLENYKITVDAYGTNRNLKIVSASNGDLKSLYTTIKCIESNG